MIKNGIKLWNITWETTTAGPSPDNNKRVELFLLGCEKAKNGDPCVGCFNSATWDSSIAEITHDPYDMVENIQKFAPNKYITIGGGEPTDQIDNLIILCKLLKEKDFHIMVYTWRDLKKVMSGEYGPEMKNKFKDLLIYIDILVDGQFIIDERLYQEDKEDGLLNSIGSGNQIIWDVKNYRNNNQFINGVALRDLDAIQLINNDEIIYFMKDKDKEFEHVDII